MSDAQAMRVRAVLLREQAEAAAVEHAQIARAMLGAAGVNERAALELEAQVADCMSRRYQLWAAKLDEAAYELENP